MGALIKVIKGTMTKAPDKVSTQRSSLALQNSAGSMQVLQQAGIKDAQVVSKIVQAIGDGGKLDQGKTRGICDKASAITNRYHQLLSIKEPLNVALDDALKSAELQAQYAEKIATTQQKIAVIGTKTEAKIGWGHQKAGNEVAFYTGAYGGESFHV